MRGSAVQGRLNPAGGFGWHAARLLASALLQAWRGCQIIGWRIARQRTRRALAQLDDRMLQDIGITREQALREAAKPLWWE